MTKICDCGHNQGDHRRFGDGGGKDFMYFECDKCICEQFGHGEIHQKLMKIWESRSKK